MIFHSEKRIHRSIDGALQKSQEGKYQEAIKILERTLPTAHKAESPNICARIEYALGECYYSLPNNGELERNLGTAIKYFTVALTYYSESNDPYAFILISEKLGKIYKYLYEKNKGSEELQSVIKYYTQALNVFRNSFSIFTTLNNYKTETASEMKKEDYIYLHAAIQLNLTYVLKEKAKVEEKAENEYLKSLKISIDLFNSLVDTHNLHQADYLNGWYNLGAAYNMLSEKSDEKTNLDYAVNAYENGLKYYFSKKRFKEMYPKYFDTVVKQIQGIKQKTGDIADVDEYKSYENVRQEIDEDVCRNCGEVNIIKGYTIPLCEKCRKAYVRFRVPVWIKAFAAFIFAVLLFAMFKFPTSLGVGIDYERGIRADKEMKCQTALKYLTKAQSEYQDSFIINARIFIDLAKCSKYNEAGKIFNEKIANQEISDQSLYNEIGEMYKKVFMPDENYSELMQIVNNKSQESTESTIKKIEDYNQKYPQSVEGLAYLGNILFEQGKFEEARDLELKALSLQPYRDEIRLALAGTYRQTGELDKSMDECKYILENINSENTIAIGSISRLYLKKHQFDEALNYAKKALEIDGDEMYNIETIALAYHFNNMVDERDAAVKKIENMDYNQEIKQKDLKFLQEVFAGTSKFYN